MATLWGNHLFVLQVKKSTRELNLLCKVSTIILMDTVNLEDHAHLFHYNSNYFRTRGQ